MEKGREQGRRSASSEPADEKVEKKLSIYTRAMDSAQVEKLRELLRERGWKFETKEYMLYFARGDRVTVSVYEKGPKIVVAGKGTQEFVEFTLEPEILQAAEIGYEEVHQPEMFEPHFGVDESGKGDFFGPLVIAGCFSDRELAKRWIAAGVQDSKAIGSDARIKELAKVIRESPGVAYRVIVLKPARYNALYQEFKSLNKMLSWGHASAIAELYAQRPECERAVSDQFGDPKNIMAYLEQKNVPVQLVSRTKAESDIAVAAASILARQAVVEWGEKARKELGFALPRGASDPGIIPAARRACGQHGIDFLEKIAKTHFRTAHRAFPEQYAAPTKNFFRGKWTKFEPEEGN
jgi:ribonuclease HIII